MTSLLCRSFKKKSSRSPSIPSPSLNSNSLTGTTKEGINNQALPFQPKYGLRLNRTKYFQDSSKQPWIQINSFGDYPKPSSDFQNSHNSVIKTPTGATFKPDSLPYIDTSPCSSNSLKENLPPILILLSRDNDHDDDFVEEIYYYLIALEQKTSVSADFLLRNGLASNSRAILHNWTIKMQKYFRNSSESVHLACSLSDFFLSHNKIMPDEYQLVILASYFMAVKNVERIHPPVSQLCYLTNFLFNERQLLEMERRILLGLRFKIMPIIPHDFFDTLLRGCIDVEGASMPKLRKLCLYLFDLLLIDKASADFLPSLRCCASIYYARVILYAEVVYEEEPIRLTDSNNNFCGENNFSKVGCDYNRVTGSVKSSNIRADFRDRPQARTVRSNSTQICELPFMKNTSCILSRFDNFKIQLKNSLQPVQELWPQNLRQLSGYNEEDLLACTYRYAHQLHSKKSVKLDAAYVKHSSAENDEIANCAEIHSFDRLRKDSTHYLG